MRINFYTRLAVNNIRKNSKTYIPYILTCIMTVMMFYMVKSLSLNPGLTKMVGDATVVYTMGLGTRVIGLFAVIFLFYTNSFLVKRRKKEFGLFHILGMEKKHLAKVLFIETVIVMGISLGAGLLFGIALDKIMFLVITKIIGGELVLGFFISAKAIAVTFILFGIIFLLIFLKSVYTIQVSKPIELLRGNNVGEKEPKVKWLTALLGAGLLGVGYYIALTIKNPLVSLYAFFIAVIMVIIATYLLFTAGSIVVLKLMRKNQKFYYKTQHFISVSGMIYRMKQNAVGLANICILSTGVLIMVSTTTSLMVGMEDIINCRYPNDFAIYSSETDASHNEEIFGEIDAVCQEMNVLVTNRVKYSYMGFSVCEQGDTFLWDDSEFNIVTDTNSLRLLCYIPLSDYNTVTGENHELGEKEVIFFSNRESYNEPVIHLFNQTYVISERMESFFGNGKSASNIVSTYYMIINDSEFQELIDTAKVMLDRDYNANTYYGIDTAAGKDVQQELGKRIREILKSEELITVESKVESRNSFLGLYGGLFFLGIFLGFLFTMATILIIYYKQISEGYEDRERFIIMQKVGMTRGEVKHAIRSQVLIVFFLPLAAAGIHVAVAFPMLTLLLALLNMANVKLYLACTVVCFLIFAVMYIVIYGLTAKTYYKIVTAAQE